MLLSTDRPWHGSQPGTVQLQCQLCQGGETGYREWLCCCAHFFHPLSGSEITICSPCPSRMSNVPSSPAPKQEGSCDKYIYFPKVLLCIWPHIQQGRADEGSARSMMRFRARGRLEGGSEMTLPGSQGQGCREEGVSADHLILSVAFLSPELCYDVLVVPGDVTTEHRGGPLTVDRRGQEEGRVRHSQGQHSLAHAPDHLHSEERHKATGQHPSPRVSYDQGRS